MRRALDAGVTDSAAALTYYVLLSMVPCITLIVAIVGLVGRDPETTDAIVEVIQQGGSGEAAEMLRSGLQSALESTPKSGAFLGIGLIATLYVASLYVSAFARAAKALGGEGRRSELRRRPLQALATFGGIIILALALLALAISRRIAEALADVTGLGLFANDFWPLVKWGFVLVSLVVIVSGLYSLDPTRPRRWPPRPTCGGLVAVGLLVVATVGFEVYLGTLAGYDQTYGALGGIVTFLVWTWLSNMVLLYGVALDQERRPVPAPDG
ncbi:MAG: YihY/virulence factor BrkB family protein [bacterium]